MKPSVSPDHCVAAGVGIWVLLLTRLMYAMPLRLTITPAGHDGLLPCPLVLREAVDGLKRGLHVIVCCREIAVEVGRIDRDFGCRLIVRAAASAARRGLPISRTVALRREYVAVGGRSRVDMGGVHLPVAYEIPVVDESAS